MKITHKNEFVSYDGIEYGQAFTHNGQCYMKTNQRDADDGRPLAVNLRTREMSYFGEDAYIAPVACEVIVG